MFVPWMEQQETGASTRPRKFKTYLIETPPAAARDLHRHQIRSHDPGLAVPFILRVSHHHSRMRGWLGGLFLHGGERLLERLHRPVHGGSGLRLQRDSVCRSPGPQVKGRVSGHFMIRGRRVRHAHSSCLAGGWQNMEAEFCVIEPDLLSSCSSRIELACFVVCVFATMPISSRTALRPCLRPRADSPSLLLAWNRARCPARRCSRRKDGPKLRKGMGFFRETRRRTLCTAPTTGFSCPTAPRTCICWIPSPRTESCSFAGGPT